MTMAPASKDACHWEPSQDSETTASTRTPSNDHTASPSCVSVLSVQEGSAEPLPATEAVAGKPSSGAEPQAGDEGASDIIIISQDSKPVRKRCAPFEPLVQIPLLGDSASDEEMKFGETIPKPSFCALALKKTGEWPMLTFRNLFMAIPAILLISMFASLPCHLDKDTTPLTAGLFGFVNMICCLITIMSVLFMSAHKNKLDVFKWVLCTFWMLPLLSCGAQLKLNDMGKGSKGLASQIIVLPASTIIAMAKGKVNISPGWTPKWNTCCGGCRGANKAVASVTFVCLTALIAGIVLITFIRQDTLTLSESTSKSMIIVRPTLFFVVKKLFYHAFASFSRLRHPILTKATNIGASVMLGIATAILFTNTRSWLDLITFIAGNWFTFLSKLWTLFGSKWADKCIVLKWYSWFMSTGKPIVAPKVNKLQLRGFEIQAQNFGTTYGLVVIIAFYPIAVNYFGKQSMIYKLLFATESSLAFLAVALVNEIIEDNLGQLLIGHLTNNDFSKLYSFIPSQEMALGLQMNVVFGSIVCSSGWMFRAQEVGPFKEA